MIAPAEASREPRALRRRALRPARRRRRRPADDVQQHARTTASAPRSSAASCSAPTRCRRGYYDAYYGTRAAGAHEDRRRLPRRLRARRLRRHADRRRRVAFELGEQDRRPAGDVPERLLHGADVAGRDPGDLDPGGPERRACPSASSSPARRSARTASSTPRTRSSRRSASTERERRALSLQRRDYEPVIGLEIHVQLQDADEDVLRLRAVVRRASPTRTPARSASASRARCRWPTREAVHYGLMIGAGARLRARAALDLPPQELLLSRPAEGLPDLPVRRPAVPRRRGWATCASTACTWRRTRPSSIHVGASGRIHGAERERRRLQPRRHAAGRDRHRARPALGRAGAASGCGCCARRCASSASAT